VFHLSDLTYEHFLAGVLSASETLFRLQKDGIEVKNEPVQKETFEQIDLLRQNIFVPVQDRFNLPIALTYGFAGLDLIRHIRKNASPGIAPKLDQHAGCELKKDGTLICSRGGFAADFFVKGATSLSVGQWIVANCDYDRLYFYGDQRPLHVSVGPEKKRQIVLIQTYDGLKKIPRNLTTERFLAL
jgi:hypothetical protein